MAFIHTNFLTGNDTTGNGSTTTPYKTVGQALAVAVSNDFIKVAGGQWTALSGDFTFTYSSNIVTTSVDQTGLISVNNIITFEDGQYGFDKFHYMVTAVSSSTISLSKTWSGPTQISSGVYKLDAAHYSASTGTSFENWGGTAGLPSTTIPNGRTGITISGGWSSDFTTQNGWTVCVNTAVTNQTINLFRLQGGAGNIGDWQNNLIVTRLMMVNTGGALFVPTTAAGSRPTTFNSFAIDELAFVTGNQTGAIVNSTFGSGVFNPDSNTPCKIYDGNLVFIVSNLNGLNGNYLGASSETNWELWSNLSGPTAGTYTFQTHTIASSSLGLQGSPNKLDLYMRTNLISENVNPDVPGTFFNYLSPVVSTGSGIYINNLYAYFNAPGVYVISANQGSTTQIENVEYRGTFAASPKNGIKFSSGGQVLVDLSQEGKLIEDFNPCMGYSFGAPANINNEQYNQFSNLVSYNATYTQVRDAEGLKTSDVNSNIYFKDSVNDWLRISGAGIFGNGQEDVEFGYSWKVMGVKEKPQAPFTITIRLKDDGNGGDWNKIAVQYGPNPDQFVEESITLTTDFEDYFITVDPDAISDWNLFSFPIYIGISSKMWNLNSTTPAGFSNCFVQSITIS